MLNRLRDLFRRQLSVTSQVNDSTGWRSLTGRPQDYDPARLQEIYADALEAWRKNPIAWRIIAITTDYVIGERFTISSTNPSLNRFIKSFWHHPQNRMDLRLESMSDELARAGDLFVVLFRNPQDGMSYIRFVTKDRIIAIESASNDWESEQVFYEIQDYGEPKAWLSPTHPNASEADAIMLHYAINRPLGALMGESDLITIIPWLLRYSRILEDRVRLHSAMRSFLWDVTVPANVVQSKKEQYRTPPDGGSILIHDDSEIWKAIAPDLNATDARHDQQAIRAMIDAGSGYPPHWRGDAGDISLATAQAMQGPTERHLTRRQKYFAYILQDILYHAYQRAAEAGFVRRLSRIDYSDLFTITAPDISRFDNQSLAQAARDLSQAFYNMSAHIGLMPTNLARLILRSIFKFAGEPIAEDVLESILAEIKQSPPFVPNIEDPTTEITTPPNP